MQFSSCYSFFSSLSVPEQSDGTCTGTGEGLTSCPKKTNVSSIFQTKLKNLTQYRTRGKCKMQKKTFYA